MDIFFRLLLSNPGLYAHTPFHPWTSVADLEAEFYETPSNHLLSFSNPESFSFAVVDKTYPASADDRGGELAGTLGFTYTSPTNLCTEIGFVVILPQYQRSHVAPIALQHALNSTENGRLGLCRVH
jgi:RimJ/RimL family protein N-acetyltransferase